MPRRHRALGLPLVAVLLGAGLSSAAARDDAFLDGPPRPVRAHRRPVAPPPIYTPPPLISGYLPRHHGVPMYNEPPGLNGMGYGAR